MEYIAIKVEGLKHWIWFRQDKVIMKEGVFNGKGGWGKKGALTEIKNLNTWFIDGFLYSDALQYGN